MANKPISVTIKGDYTDRDVKRAIKDLQSLQTQGPRTSKALGNVAKGLGLAAAAAGALAIKMGIDAVRAANEEEVSVGRLSQTLKNLGLAASDAGVEKFIDDMQFATGIADNNLRPAMDRLVRSTGDVAEAQRALQIAADIAVAKQRDVTDVANILGKAYDGNTMALGRLGVGLDKSVLKSGDMVQITGELSRLFKGQAAAAADTLTGRAQILKISIDELNESFGKGLLKGFFDGLQRDGGTLTDFSDQIRAAQGEIEAFGIGAGGVLASLLQGFINFGAGAMKVADFFQDRIDGTTIDLINLQDKLGLIDDATADAMRRSIENQKATRDQALANYLLVASGKGVISTTNDATGATTRLTTAGESDVQTMDKRKAAADRLKASLDKLNDNRSIMRQRINLRRMLAEGPQGTGKDGKVTARDKRLFALDVADARAQLGEDIYNRGGKGSKADARRQFSLGRENLRDLGFGDKFINNVLRTPTVLLPNSGPRPGTPETGQQVANVNYTFNFGDIKVDSVADAIQRAKEAARLSKLGRGATADAMRYAGMAAAS